MLKKPAGNILDKDSTVSRSKPQLTTIQFQLIKGSIIKSIEDHSPVWLKVFYPKYDRVLHGIIMTADYQQQRIEMRTIRNQSEWIEIKNILNII